MKNFPRLCLVFFSTLILSLGLFSYATAANNDVEMEMKQSDTQATIRLPSGRLPEGVMIQRHHIVLKKGYRYRQMSRSKVNIISPLKGNITGSIECRCKFHGNCRIHATPLGVFCVRGNCGGGCQLRINTPQVTIMGGEQPDANNGTDQPQ